MHNLFSEIQQVIKETGFVNIQKNICLNNVKSKDFNQEYPFLCQKIWNILYKLK